MPLWNFSREFSEHLAKYWSVCNLFTEDSQQTETPTAGTMT